MSKLKRKQQKMVVSFWTEYWTRMTTRAPKVELFWNQSVNAGVNVHMQDLIALCVLTLSLSAAHMHSKQKHSTS